MNEIGGYFELELDNRVESLIHSDSVCVNSGRNALEYILRKCGDVERVMLPRYTCNVVLEPLNKLGIQYDFYSINAQFEIDKLPLLSSGEYLIVNNYFGLKDDYIFDLSKIYADQLIVDNAQALYCLPNKKVNTLYSPRKFVGLPDGGFAYCNKGAENIVDLPQDISYDRCRHLLRRIDEGASAGYSDFVESSKSLVGVELRQMSKLTAAIMRSIDFDDVKSRRRANFDYLHSKLSASNLLSFDTLKG